MPGIFLVPVVLDACVAPPDLDLSLGGVAGRRPCFASRSLLYLLVLLCQSSSRCSGFCVMRRKASPSQDLRGVGRFKINFPYFPVVFYSFVYFSLCCLREEVGTNVLLDNRVFL